MMLGQSDHDKTRKYVNSLATQGDKIVESLISITYYMRGGVQYDDMFFRTPAERTAMSEFITKRIEAQKGSMSPVY